MEKEEGRLIFTVKSAGGYKSRFRSYWGVTSYRSNLAFVAMCTLGLPVQAVQRCLYCYKTEGAKILNQFRVAFTPHIKSYTRPKLLR